MSNYISLNDLMQKYRRELIINVLLLDADYYEITKIEKNTELVIEKVDIDDAINNKLTTLEKQIINCLYVDRYTVRETAKMLDMSIGTVSKLSNSALDKIVNYCM